MADSLYCRNPLTPTWRARRGNAIKWKGVLLKLAQAKGLTRDKEDLLRVNHLSTQSRDRATNQVPSSIKEILSESLHLCGQDIKLSHSPPHRGVSWYSSSVTSETICKLHDASGSIF